MVRLDGVIALAGDFSQPFGVGDFDLTPAVAKYSRLLKRIGDDRNRIALHAGLGRLSYYR